MNLWILKYDKEDFSTSYVENLENYAASIYQLERRSTTVLSNGRFHFLSIHSIGIPKIYNQVNENAFKGYSGLLIDKSPQQNDLRSITNVEVENPEKFFGQLTPYQNTQTISVTSQRIYKQYINTNKDSEIFNFINKDEVISETSKGNYNGKYNQIGSMIKTIEQHKSL